MSEMHPIDDDRLNETEEAFAIRLEQIDEALSHAGGSRARRGADARDAGAPSAGQRPGLGRESLADSKSGIDPAEVDPAQVDPAQVDGAARVLRMIHRVRDYEYQSGHALPTIADPAPATSNTGSESPPADSVDESLISFPDRIGRFKLQHLLGQGGFGLVFLAHDTALNRPVAIKLPRPEVLADGLMTERFLREGRAAAALNHPNIVPVYEVGHFGNVGFIASAYCPGGTLAQWLRDRAEPLEPRAAAALVARLADAVQHAHRRSVFHRDLKPANILLEAAVEQSGFDELALAETARISDFGLAKFEADGATTTQPGGLIGTPAYMPPEQADQDLATLGPTADVYSLGAILFELLCRQPPFQEPTILATLEAVRHRAPPAPRQIAPNTPRDLEAITLKCLEKQPEHRYESALELADDLDRFLEGQPVRARHLWASERWWRWCRRNPLVAMLAAAVVVLAIGSTVASVQLVFSKQRIEAALSETVRTKRQAAASEFNAQVAYAQTLQQSLRPGRRSGSLRALERASGLARELGTMATEQRGLRNAVITAFGFPDLQQDKQWPVVIVGERFLATDPTCEIYARVDDDSKQVILHRVADNRIEATLPLAANHQRLIGFRFSPDGSWLGARYQLPSLEERLRVWDLATQQLVADHSIGGFGQAAGFSPSGDMVALLRRNGRAVELRSLPAFALVSEIPVGPSAETLAVDAAGTRVAVSSSTGIEVFDLATQQSHCRLDCPKSAVTMSFSPDGRKLAVGCRDGRIDLFRIEPSPVGEPLAADEMLQSHSAMVVNVAWHPTRNLLASCSMDGKSLLWDLDHSEVCVELDQKCTNFSRDGRWLGVEGGRMRLDLSESHRVFPQSESKVYTPFELGLYRRREVTSEIDYWVTLPGSSLVIGQNFYRIVIRDLATHQPLADLEVPACWFRFDPQGTCLYAASQTVGFCRLPIVRYESDSVIQMQIGPPEVVHPARGGAFALNDDRVLLTPYLQPGLMLNRADGTSVARLKVHPFTFWCDLSADGRLAATGVIRARDVRVFDAASGDLIQTLESGTAAPWFSPDGSTLVVAENARYRFFDTESWECTHEIESVAGGIWPASLRYSPDGKLLALENGSSVQLVDPRSYQRLADFPVDSTQRIDAIGFSGDGRYLVSGGGDEGRTHVWDLWAIRRQLREFGLDWGSETMPETPSRPHKRIELDLQLGDLTRPPVQSDWLPRNP